MFFETQCSFKIWQFNTYVPVCPLFLHYYTPPIQHDRSTGNRIKQCTNSNNISFTSRHCTAGRGGAHSQSKLNFSWNKGKHSIFINKRIINVNITIIIVVVVAAAAAAGGDSYYGNNLKSPANGDGSSLSNTVSAQIQIFDAVVDCWQVNASFISSRC